MEYMVIGADGKEYGPVDFAALVEWAKDDRVRPGSSVRELATGRVMSASEIPGLFIPAAMNSQSSPYYRPGSPGAAPEYSRPVQINTGALVWSFVDSALAVIMGVAFGGFGVIWGAFGIVNGFRAKAEGHQLAPVAIGCACAGTIFAIVMWAIKGTF